MNRRRNKKAFTLLELTIAVGVLSMMMVFSGRIFKMCIDGHRNAAANADIMQRLRVITEQLNLDFSGMCKDAPVLIKFRQDPDDPNIRDDQIMFFATGDFQSIQLYDENTGEPFDLQSNTSTGFAHTIRGNAARVYYGLARSNDPNKNGQLSDKPMDLDAADRILARRRHILTGKIAPKPGDTTFKYLDFWPIYNDLEKIDLFNETITLSGNTYKKNELYEHDSMSLAHWKTIDIKYYEALKPVLITCFGDNSGNNRTEIDMADPLTFHKLLCEHVGSFAVQWSYWDIFPNKQLRWYPSNDPDGDGFDNDSHFRLAGYDEYGYGVYFNIPWGAAITNPDRWHGIDSNLRNPKTGVEYDNNRYFQPTFFPKAFKFTFRIYDSKGFIKGGRLFTHIVYVD